MHLAGSNSNVKEFDNDENSSVSVDTEDNESPSFVVGGNSDLEELDDKALTHHHVGVLCGYDNNIYIPTLVEVFDSINQDHLFAFDDDDELTVNEEIWAYLGIVLPVEDDNDNEFESESDTFDVNNLQNIFTSALYRVLVAKTSSEAAAESWFEAVDVKLKFVTFEM